MHESAAHKLKALPVHLQATGFPVMALALDSAAAVASSWVLRVYPELYSLASVPTAADQESGKAVMVVLLLMHDHWHRQRLRRLSGFPR